MEGYPNAVRREAGIAMTFSKQMKTPKTRDFQKEPMNLLEAEIAVTALHATGEF